jgi:hypothetical protein
VTSTQVDAAAVVAHDGAGLAHPPPAVHPEVDGEPVGDVDQALLFDLPALEHRVDPVEQPGDVGARVRDPVVGGEAAGPPRPEVAVAERGERLAHALGGGFGVVELEVPGVLRWASAFEHERPEVGDDHVGTPVEESGRVIVAVDADHEAEPPGTPGGHPRHGVFDHRRLRGCDPEAAGGLEEHRRRGLPRQAHRRGRVAVDPRLDERGDAGQFEDLGAVPAG